MIPYRVKYTESEYDIQNSDLLLVYKTHQKHQNTFDELEIKLENQKNKIGTIKLLCCNMYNFHNSCFVFFGILGNLVYFIYFIFYVI